MRPTNRFFLLALIIFLLFGTVPTVLAVEPTAEDFTNAFSATCADPAMSHFGEITPSSQVDYYAIDLVAGQFFTIDVDAEKIESPLDSILEVFDASGELVAVSVDSSSGMDISPDPYLEMTVDVGGTYYLAISAETPGAGADTGPYTLLLTCSTQPPAPEFTWPLKVGDLIGSTGSTGSLINITPETAESSLPFDLGVGSIADIEYQYSTDTLLVAIDDNPGSIIAIDPVTGAKVQTFKLVPETGTIVPAVFALEAGENMLYGVQVDPSSEQSSLVQVTFDDSDPTDPKATLTPVFFFGAQQVRALAYHSVEKVIYAVASIVSTSDLIKIHLEPELLVETTSAIPIVDQTSGEPVNVVSLDFSHENFLFGVDLLGNLHEIDHTNGQAVSRGEPTAKVSSLTFVVGEPPDVEPIKTICSSTYTTSASASPGTSAPKLSRFTLKKNPLHRAVGLFKFKGIEGETVTLNVWLEGEGAAEAVAKESSASELENRWLEWKGKGRVFLGVRDAIPGVDFRVRKKDQLPLTMSATLPADGTYYVMLIRPLLGYYRTDYCLTLESDFLNSEAADTLDVAWPHDHSGNDSTTTLDEAKVVETQNFDAVVSTSTANEPESGTTVTNEPAAESDTEVVQTDVGEETPVVEPVAETPAVSEPVTEGGDATEVVQPVAGDTTVEEPIAEVPVVQESTNDTGNVETQPADDAVSGGETSEGSAPASDTTVEDPVVETVVDEPVVETPVETDPAAEDGSEIESVDEETSDEFADDAPVDEEYSDEPMEDPLPMKG
ncbi:MAG: pre-peptidase C-terminal domain-containing protein [Syntrophobacterales bacterium]|jgi:hypothetical protein